MSTSAACAWRIPAGDAEGPEAFPRRPGSLLPLPLRTAPEIGSCVSSRRFRARQVIADRGRPDGGFHLIEAGCACSYRFTAAGDRLVLDFHLPGDIRDMTVTAQSPFTVEAIEGTWTATISRSDMLLMTTRHPDILRWQHARFSADVVRVHSERTALSRLSADGRLAWFLMRTRRRISLGRSPSSFIPLPMTRYDIADYLGLSTETISRSFSRLENDRIVTKVPGGVRLLETQELGRRASLTFERCRRTAPGAPAMSRVG